MTDIRGSAQHKSLQHRRQVLELYAVYRAYLVHEDTLIGQRTQRMLLVQGALFTAAGAVIGRLFSELDQTVPKNLSCPLHPKQTMVYPACLVLIGVTGILAAYLSRGAIKAAATAATFLCTEWTEINKIWKDAGELTCRQLHLPELFGAGAPKVHDRGQLHVVIMPMYLMIIWTVSVALLCGAWWHFRQCW